MSNKQTFTSTAPEMRPDEPVHTGWLVFYRYNKKENNSISWNGKPYFNGNYSNGPFVSYEDALKASRDLSDNPELEVVALCNFFYQDGDHIQKPPREVVMKEAAELKKNKIQKLRGDLYHKKPPDMRFYTGMKPNRQKLARGGVRR